MNKQAEQEPHNVILLGHYTNKVQYIKQDLLKQ